LMLVRKPIQHPSGSPAPCSSSLLTDAITRIESAHGMVLHV
jgi:hypothetical protein